jgi:hypothetical protein
MPVSSAASRFDRYPVATMITTPPWTPAGQRRRRAVGVEFGD